MEKIWRGDSHKADNRNKIDIERFEKSARVKIQKGKEKYRGGSGFYAAVKTGNSPNALEDTSE